ncbi:MAG: beta-lactamase family protein [Bacteroidales bacterium]|nr:beta-lactamase family protein [Bacteroidales bacterium]
MKKFLTKSLLLTLTIAAMTACSEKKAADPIADAMQKVDSLMVDRYTPIDTMFAEPGGAVLIMKGDSILFDKGYGCSDIARGYKIDGNTFFNIASCSKQFSAVAILKLAEEGKLDIQKSIYDVSPLVTPYLPKKKAPFTDITPAHLMSHASGIPDTRPRTDLNFMLKCTDMQSIEYMKGLKELNFTPGTEYQYINPTFQLLYLFIEKLSGMSFDDFMKEKLFTPAKMLSTLYFSEENESKIPNMAHGYILEDGNEAASVDSDKPAGAVSYEPEKKSDDTPHSKFAECDYGEETFFATKADGGLYTSTHEFANWIKAMRDNKILPARAKEEAWSLVNNVSGSKFSTYQNRDNTFYGYGWFIEQQPGFPKKVYHTGDNGGFQIYEGYFPEADLTVLVFENRNDKDRWDLVRKIDQILKDAGLTEPIAKEQSEAPADTTKTE